MKGILYLLLFCCGTSLSGYLLTVQLKPGTAMVDLLPADTIALVQYDNFSKMLEDWRGSTFGEKLHQPTFPKILEQLGVPASETTGFTMAVAAIDRFINASSLNKIFHEQGIVALLPSPQGSASEPLALSRNLVAILQVHADLDPEQSISAFFGSTHTPTTTHYQGESLTTLIFDGGQTITYAHHRGHLLLALESKQVQRCIDQSLQRMVQSRSGLESNPAYQRLRTHAGKQTDFFLYVDRAGLAVYMPELQRTDYQDKGLSPQHLSLFHQKEAESSRLGIVALVGQEELAALTDQYQLALPVEKPGFQRVSSETQFSFWTNWFKARTLWSWGIRSSDSEVRELMMALAQRLFEITGKTTDDIFDVFGSGFGVFINDQNDPHHRAMGGLSIEVLDREKTEALLKQLLAGLQVVSIRSQEAEIVTVIMAGGLLQPAYTLSGNTLLLADNVELIEQELRRDIQTHTPQAMIEGNEETRFGNGFLFIRTRTMVDRWLPILTLLTRETREKTKLLPEKARLLIEQVAIPLLTSLKSLETCLLRGYAAGDEVFLELQYSAHR